MESRKRVENQLTKLFGVQLTGFPLIEDAACFSIRLILCVFCRLTDLGDDEYAMGKQKAMLEEDTDRPLVE